jgi:hypothetical protein
MSCATDVRRWIARTVVALVIAVLGFLTVASPSDAEPPPTQVNTIGYDAPAHDQSMTYTAPERGPPAAHPLLGVSAGQPSIVNGSGGAFARPDVLVAYDYDSPPLLVQVAHDGDSGEEAAVAASGGLPRLQPGLVAAKGADAVVDACRVNSFTGHTQVLMADGTTKPLKDAQLRDWVLARDPITGERGARQVIDLIRHSGAHTMVAVRLADGATIDATDHHPFWVASRGAWVDAG